MENKITSLLVLSALSVGLAANAIMLDASSASSETVIPPGWSSHPEGNLDLETEVTRSGGVALLWRLQWWSNRLNPDAKHSAWDAPSHQYSNLRLRYLENSITYNNPEHFASVDIKNSGLRLWINCGSRPALAKRLLRLELLNGDEIVGTGLFYEPRGWGELKMPYRMANDDVVTGFRIVAPTHSTPLWNEYAPTSAAIDNVDIDSGDSSYNGVEIENFEEGAVPQGWTAAGGTLSIDQARFYSGKSSLRWDWNEAGATLLFKKNAPFAGRTLGLWVYNPRQSKGRLQLDFLKNGKTVFSAWYFLNFEGWHIFAAPYKELGWTPEKQPDSFRISAPESADTGTLWLDFLNFDARGWPAAWYRPPSPSADNQQPWIGKPELLSTPERCHYSAYDLSVGRPWLPPLTPADQITSDQLEFIREHQPAPPSPPSTGQGSVDIKRVEAALAGIARWNIKEQDGVLTGSPIEGKFNVPPDAMALNYNFNSLVKDTAKSCLAARNAGDAESERQLLDALVLLLRYASDQGYFSQSNNNIPFGEVSRDSLVYLRESVPRDIFDEFMADVIFQATNGGSLVKEEPSGNSDMVQGYYSRMPRLMYLFEDPAKSLQYVQIFTRAINRICSRVDLDCFGPDGTFFHHGLHHWSYAAYEFPTFLRFIEHFHGSSFQLAPESYDICRKFIFTMAWSFCKYTMPSSMAARPGIAYKYNFASLAGRMADIGTADGQSVDRYLAALYLALTDKPDSGRAKKYRAMEISPYKFDGHRVVNGAATSIHRREDWMVGLVGMNKNNPGASLEIYGGAKNSYSSFARNGAVCVVSSGSPTSCQASGWSFEGWDSRHYPGCTNPLGKPQELWAAHKGVRNGSSFAGGTDLDGNGVWGFDLKAEGVAARKSAFCFGSRITLITSNVETLRDDGLPIATTLYQNSFKDDPATEPSFIDGAEDNSFPSAHILSGSESHWLLDNKGTGYYIHAGQTPLKTFRREQTWFYLWPEYLIDRKKDPMRKVGAYSNLQRHGRKKVLSMSQEEIEEFYKPTSNNFALAYFDHGSEPDPGGCAYSLLVRSNPDEMDAFAKAMDAPGSAPYRIIQKDESAHVLWDRDTKTTGYVVFAGKRWVSSSLPNDPRQSKLLSVSRHCLVMVKEAGDHELKISTVSTDWKDKTPLTLTLEGTWEIESTDTRQTCDVMSENGKTTIRINYEFEKPTMGYMPIHMTLHERDD